MDSSTAELRTALGPHGRTRRLRLGERVVIEGGSAGSVMLLTSGVVKVVATTPDGDEVAIAIRRAGDLIGDHAAISGLPRSAGVTVVEAGEAIVVPANRFLDVLAENPSMALSQLRRVLRTLRESDERLVEIVTMRAGDRVVRRLRALAQESGTGRINLSQDELAALSATSRSAVAQVLSQLRAAGAITTARRSIEVVDIAKLESIDPLTLTTD